MKKNNKITFSAMMAALSCTFMFLSYFPYLTYAIPGIAGMFIMAIVIEINCKWAIGGFLASAFFVLLFAEIESAFMFVGFLGYYPIVKAAVERLRKPIIEWIIKIVCFNVAVLIVYLLLSKITGFSTEEFGKFAEYGLWILLAAGNVVFVVYDIAVSRVAMMYMGVIRPKLGKIIK